MVWSDPRIKKLSREFVTVAEEVHFLYPEGKWSLDRLANDPAHLFFKKFGEQAPKGGWRHPGTKQGIYFIGPNAEFLESAPTQSGNPAALLRKMQEALTTWKKIKAKQKYANKEVPPVATFAPPPISESPFVLRVFLRDLPRSKRDNSGRRFKKTDIGKQWMSFTRWAWNVNWIGFDDPKAFVTKSAKDRPVPEKVAERLARRVLVDNVRGQNPAWRRGDLKKVELVMRRVEVKKGIWHLVYHGEASMESKNQSYHPKLVGRAQWDPKKKSFESFELVAIGDRKGQGRFNQRRNDLGPAPMGIALVSVEKPKPPEAKSGSK